jgi:mannose-6-phosphate isomerase-like protein (cupin superfamily)
MTRFEHAAVSMPGDGIISTAFGRRVLRITAADTAGAMAVWDETVGPGAGAPLHVHDREDELFRVVEGRFRFWCGAETFDAGAGATMLLPRGVPHRFQNVGETDGRVLVAVTPGGFEQFFLDVERERATTPEAIGAIAARYGLTFMPPEQQAAA